ncbi:MAG TPA: RdgB/HAM1 family non-canonical purine NTP pyrophosphatase [Burkholderiaceae bacterium]|jgi:XTP/dITP diphosphohydrolase|nr:RdgB/HAM1 family non-canonical purine NTP pyrophosphatase [Burkholderiaceae bacterium]
MTPARSRRLVLASGNAGKVVELQALLQPLRIEVLPQRKFGVIGAEEPHPTFLENALAKARHAAQATGLPALADDSGLCCAALDGAPGVRSARFAGEGASDAQNNAALIGRLAAVEDRSAHYVCVLVAVRAADDPEPVVAEGRWYGRIVLQPRGSNGFGYDPYFWLDELGATAAELAPEHKNSLSHRGQAMRQLCGALAQRWSWL